MAWSPGWLTHVRSVAGPPVPAGLRPVCSTSDPLRPCPADPGLRGLLPGTCGPPHLLVLPSASPGRPSVARAKPGRSHHGRRSPTTALVRWGTNGSSGGGKRGPTASPPPVWLQGSRPRGWGMMEGSVADISRPFHIPGLCCVRPWYVPLSRLGAFSDPGLGPSEVRLGGLARSLGPVSYSSGETAELALSHALPTAAATS